MVQQLGYKLAGDFTACDTCNAIMSKAKSIPKLSSIKSTFVDEQMGLDSTGPFPVTSDKFQ